MSKKYIIKNGTVVEVSDEVYKILRKWDRRIKYVEHDLKETRYIQFEDTYSIEEKSERKVQYADSREVEAEVLERFPPKPVPVEFMKKFDRMEVEEELSRKHPPKTRKRN